MTRAAEQSEALCDELKARGAVPIVAPLVAFATADDTTPLDAALRGFAQFDWMFLTSQNAVRALVAHCRAIGSSVAELQGAMQIAVVGPATAEAAKEAGLKVHHVATTHLGVALARELAEQIRGCSVLLPRSDRANADLPEALRRAGARVTEVVAYKTVSPENVDEDSLETIASGEADAILFFSPSAVHHFVERMGIERLRERRGTMVYAAVGPVTAAALREAGIERIVVAPDTTVAAILDSLSEYWLAKSHAGARQG